MQQSIPAPELPPAEAPASVPPPGTPTDVEMDLVAKCKLEEVRSASRAAAQKMYEAGPGCKRPNEVLDLPEEHPMRKRARKTESAYISRFNAKVYTELLLAHVAAAEREVADLREKKRLLDEENRTMLWNNVLTENKVLKMQLAELTQMRQQQASASARPSAATAADSELPEQHDVAESFPCADEGQLFQNASNVREVDGENKCDPSKTPNGEVEEKAVSANREKAFPSSPTSERGTSEEIGDLVDVGSFVSEDEVVESLVW